MIKSIPIVVVIGLAGCAPPPFGVGGTPLQHEAHQCEIRALAANGGAGDVVALRHCSDAVTTALRGAKAPGWQGDWQPAPPAPPRLAPPAPPQPSPPERNLTSVPLVRHGSGTYVVEAVIAGKVRADFMIDSGASDVSMPDAAIDALIDRGILSDADFLGLSTYVLADGSRHEQATYRLSSLTVGNLRVRNVTITASGDDATYLLGQSFLSKFRSWSIDNARNALVLEGNS